MFLPMQITTLLLHLRRTAEASQHITAHVTAFATPPLPLPPSLAAAHKTWLARQFHIMADRLALFAEGGGQVPQCRLCTEQYNTLFFTFSPFRRHRASQSTRPTCTSRARCMQWMPGHAFRKLPVTSHPPSCQASGWVG